MDTIILASSSPRRKELLEQAGIPFSAISSDVDEEHVEYCETPGRLAEQLAYLKAADVAKRIKRGIVLGADTIVVRDGEILGKPADGRDARRMLEKLSGREHLVITGIALVNAADGREKIGHEVTKVRFSQLSASEIDAYIRTGEPFGKAGAYAVQGRGALFVESIDGCYTNVVGLPLRKLYSLMSEFGLRVMEQVSQANRRNTK